MSGPGVQQDLCAGARGGPACHRVIDKKDAFVWNRDTGRERSLNVRLSLWSRASCLRLSPTTVKNSVDRASQALSHARGQDMRRRKTPLEPSLRRLRNGEDPIDGR